MNIIEFLRQYRVGPFAIFDFAASYAGFLLLSPLITKLFAKINIHITWINVMWLVLPLSIVVHILIGKHTPMVKMFLDIHDYYFLKMLILFMVFMGLRKVIW